MFYPSGANKPEYRLKQLSDGVVAVDDAYAGDFEYFEGRPLLPASEREETKRRVDNFSQIEIDTIEIHSLIEASEAVVEMYGQDAGVTLTKRGGQGLILREDPA